MRDRDASPVASFLASEYGESMLALQARDLEQAWRHLERAHILAQTQLIEHCRSHWMMLSLAVRQRDWREAAGQLLRLSLAPVGNFTGRLPIGNTGRSTISAFVPMDIPPDLRAIMERKSN
ncbi:MAG: hypothetical protein C0471_10170 [Erythrobacter sp.]|jgi:hypothetical protein|nr:hypothetical protein [Erythrobacter sp.]